MSSHEHALVENNLFLCCSFVKVFLITLFSSSSSRNLIKHMIDMQTSIFFSCFNFIFLYRLQISRRTHWLLNDSKVKKFLSIILPASNHCHFRSIRWCVYAILIAFSHANHRTLFQFRAFN